MKEKNLLSKILDQTTGKYTMVRKAMDVVAELTKDPFKNSKEKPAIEAIRLTLAGKSPEEVKEEVDRQRQIFYEQQADEEEDSIESSTIKKADHDSKGRSLHSQSESLEASLKNSNQQED